MCLEVSALEIRELGYLPVTPYRLVLELDITGAPPLRGLLDFLATNLVNRLVDETDSARSRRSRIRLNDVKLIEGDCGPGQILTHASLVVRRHIHTDYTDVLGTGAMSLECIGKLGYDPGFSPFAGVEPTLGVEVVK